MDKAKEAAPSTTAGLRGVAAASSSVSDVNGEKGELIYQGYNIHDLAESFDVRRSRVPALAQAAAETIGAERSQASARAALRTAA